MDDTCPLIPSLLVAAGYPSFDLDAYGFPDPGQIVKWFREQTLYDADGRKVSWTQKDLARVLGYSEVTIRNMENTNAGLDSIERRRFIIDALKIPPVLLGFGTVEQLAAFLRTPHSGSEGPHLEKETVNLYQDVIVVYWNMYYAGIGHDSINEMERWIKRVETDRGLVTGAEQQHLEMLLCGYYQLVANLYGDKCQYATAFERLDSALELAAGHNNNELKAAILYRFGHIRLDQRNFELARIALDSALQFASQGVSPVLHGAIYQTAGLAHALVARSESDKTYSLSLLDQAWNIVRDHSEEHDNHFVRLSVGRYHLERADALITLKRPLAALKVLDKADDGIPSDQARRRAYINILRAEAYMSKPEPEFDLATGLLTSAFDVSTTIKSDYNMSYIERLCQKLDKSSYANAPDVRGLSLSLKRWKASTQSTEAI